MPSYLELYNLELTGDPYSARFITLPEIELPPECVLPIVAPYTPPVFDLTLPDLECKFDVETPIIPLPYFCTPEISGGVGIAILVKDPEGVCQPQEHPQIDITGEAGISRVPGTECDYALSGGFEICIPCIPKLEGNVTISADCTTNGPSPIQITETTPISIVYDETDCKYTLEGAISICSDCIPQYTFTSSTTTVGSGSFISGISYELVQSGDECEKALDAALTITYGDLEDLFTGVCWLDSVSVGSIVASNPVSGQTAPFVDLNFECTSYDPDDPTCCREESLGGTISIPACSSMKVQAEPARPSLDFDIELSASGELDSSKIGTIHLELDVSWADCTAITDEEKAAEGCPDPPGTEECDGSTANPCCKKLAIEFSACTASISLSSSSITLCNSEGYTDTICVLLDPRGCG